MHTKRDLPKSRTEQHRRMRGITPSTPQAPRSAAEFLPARLSMSALRSAAAGCTGCDLYKNATQTVFGEGPRDASLVLVGEQPGDQEDRAGRPFVGPAGRLLDRALADAGIARDKAYITNAVKHFKWIARGKRRLHQKPREGEIDACNPWLQAEIALLKPRALACLGATAARAAFGRSIRLKDYRGRLSQSLVAEHTLVTFHPSAILRLQEPDRAAEYARLVQDLALLLPYLSHR
jgi:uracil-DNA glycosylase